MAKPKKTTHTTTKKAPKPATRKPASAKKPATTKQNAARKSAATAKKPAATAKKPAKKPATSTRKPPGPARKPRAAKKALTADARRKLLKPRTDYEQLVEQVAVHWQQNPVLRVPKLTAARLCKLARDALRASTKETSLRAKLERQIETVYDARLLAEDAVWRAVLDVNAAVKLFARSDETLPERFAFLTDALTSSRGPSAPAEPTKPAGPVTPKEPNV